MAILNNNPLVGASGNQGGYNINNSLRFRSSASAYLNRTLTTPTNNKIWTYSAWVKRGTIASSSQQHFFNYWTGGTGQSGILFSATTDTIEFFDYTGSYGYQLVTTQVFRDPSAWYHIVVVMDTTQATSSNRIKMYVNGTQITAFSTSTYPSLNYNTLINSANAHYIGRRGDAAGYFDGYIAEQNFIDGQALTPSSFGETDTTTGVWKPKAYSGTYGTNGFYLKFSDIATTSGSNAGLGKDFSGNTNYWTTNNISVTSGTTYDAMTDSPTNTSATVANYAVLNPLDKGTSGTLDRANLQWSSGASWQSARGTMTIPSGKFYFEGIITSTTSGSIGVNFGLATAANPLNVGGNSNTASYSVDATSSSNVLTAGSQSGSGSTFAAGDVLQIAIDRDNNKAWFGRNNTWYNSTLAATGDPVAGTNATWSSLPADLFPFINTYSQTVNFNFGQRPFSYTPPTGYVALNTYNLPTPTILQGNKYMDATLYTGNGYPTSGTQSITNAASFKPDLVWIKIRSGAGSHTLTDSVRGVNSQLFSNQTAAQETNTDHVTAFNSNGFSLGTGSSGTYPSTNSNGSTYVGWQWQAGQGSTSSNTSGSITSTVSVNTTAGFSIVTYTGTGANATVGHGLGVAPKMVIVKNRSIASAWRVWVTGFAGTEQLNLNETVGKETGQITWNSTVPTSTVFSLGTPAAVNGSGNTCVAYCWAAIPGFSAFGSYTGNGSTDGPFVFTNLKARFIMIKRTDSTSNWTILDTAREGYNVDNDPLYPNLSDAEGTTDLADILSNGFKLRSTDTSVNANAGTYIYACFSSNPFKNSTAV